MKVLHLPYNVGSKILMTVTSLRKAGVDAKGIVINNLDEAGSNMNVFNPAHYSYYNPLKYTTTIQAYYNLFYWIQWADIIHWYFDYRILKTDFALKWIKFWKKPALIEWIGSDIRIPEILSEHNPHYKHAFCTNYPYQFESRAYSRNVQIQFKNAGFQALVRPELEEFVLPDIYPSFLKIVNRVNVKKYSPLFPSVAEINPLIIHPVTARNAKGTSYILHAVSALQKKYSFRFMVLENLPRSKVLEQLSQADIVIDQLILGAFGTISLEGMSLGKPVICHIDDSLKIKLPAACPIVNANPDTIQAVLESLLADPGSRNRIGKKSRAYVEKYHDSDIVALQLKNIYADILGKKQ
jgi:glycosyltransferase involved in cell wall biosynthesis